MSKTSYSIKDFVELTKREDSSVSLPLSTTVVDDRKFQIVGTESCCGETSFLQLSEILALPA